VRVPRRARSGSGGRTWKIVACSVLAATALAASLVLVAHADTLEAGQDEIRAALESWQLVFNDRDEQRVCDIFAPDVVANYDGEPERDYTSLCQMLQTAVRDRDKTYRYSLKINDILVYGETAVVRLVWTLEIVKLGDSKEIIEEPAVDIFRRQADGSWKISRYLAYPSVP
jgi:uncharacterized protein (TIGR02246 family)